MLSFEVFKMGLKMRGTLERYERMLVTLAPGGEVTFTRPCIFTAMAMYRGPLLGKIGNICTGRRHANVNVYNA
jgi:hypothetical protein